MLKKVEHVSDSCTWTLEMGTNNIELVFRQHGKPPVAISLEKFAFMRTFGDIYHSVDGMVARS